MNGAVAAVPVTSAPPSLTWKELKSTHPRLDLFRVRKLQALYRGGRTLLEDDGVMKVVFPKFSHEGVPSYTERRARVHYENVFALVVNQIAAGLAQDPCRFEAPKPEGKPKPDAKADSAEKGDVDEYWKGLMLDATPPDDDGEAKTFDQQMRAVCAEGLVSGWGWTLCDLPPAAPAASLGDQLADGALQAYPVPHSCASVLDWEERKGVLLWVKSYTCEQPAPAPGKLRAFTVHTWTIWDATLFTTYVLEISKDQKDRNGQPVNDDTVIQAQPSTPHSFERVPWVRFDCAADDEPTMHVGDLIESLVVSLFNESNGESYLRTRAQVQQLYEFLGPEVPGIDTPVSEAQQDPGRAKKGRRRSPDTVEERGQDDRAEFIAPKMEGADYNQKAVAARRESVLRVTNQLALTQDTSGAMLRRSGDSKKQDKQSELVVLGAVGKKLLGHARQVAKLLAIGRGDSVEKAPAVAGYQRFNVEDADDLVEQCVALETVSIPSATFQREIKFRTASAILGDDIDEETRESIREELEEAVTQEQFTMGGALPGGLGADPTLALPKLPTLAPKKLPAPSGDPTGSAGSSR